MMKYNEFINQVKKMKGIDADGYYKKQCMDLYNYFCNQVLGLHNCGADCAKHIINNKNIMDNVERIDNYPEFVPQKGDIAVWLGGRYGHVALCLGEGDFKTFKTLDQNWKPQTLTEEEHNYTYLAPLVFLRPKNQENITDLKPITEIAQEVIQGKWGNGVERSQKLMQVGYNATEVQNKVNEILKCAKPNLKSVDEIAKEVIRGEWGNGQDRKNRLANAGYNDEEVQNRVNQLI